MGLATSIMGKGIPSLNSVTDKAYEQFANKHIKNVDDFHIAILDTFSKINGALPGRHYNVPMRETVENFFDEWLRITEEKQRKEKFIEFMKNYVVEDKLDDLTIMVGVATPPAAMAAKKAGENLPQIKMIRAIPDIIFIPSVTLVTLIAMKFTRMANKKKEIEEENVEATKSLETRARNVDNK